MIGRKDELRELNKRFDSGKFEFGIVYGPRRIGKTTLLDEFVKLKNGFMFQAKEAEFADNFNSLSRAYRKYTGRSDKLVFSSIEDLLDDLADYSKDKRLVFVIDEFPYLAKGSKGLLSIFQEYIDRVFKNRNLLLILSGSNLSFMNDILEDKTNALYKRETFKIEISKMKVADALLFLDGTSDEDKGNYLSLFSTYPYYLSMISKSLSFEENVLDLVFSPFGTLLNAPVNVMPIGASNNKMFNSILYQISKRKTAPKEIAEALQIDSNYLSTYLIQLCEIGVIERKEMFKSSKKLNYYGLSDPFLAFYFRFVFDFTDLISLGGGRVYYENIKEDIYAYLGLGFERLVNQYMNESNVAGKLPNLYKLIQNYKVENSKLGRSIEIDGLAESIGMEPKSLLVIESKYRKKSLSMEVLNHLKESVSIFGEYARVDYYLFSKSGFADDLKALKDPLVHLITLKDVVQND